MVFVVWFGLKVSRPRGWGEVRVGDSGAVYRRVGHCHHVVARRNQRHREDRRASLGHGLRVPYAQTRHRIRRNRPQPGGVGQRRLYGSAQLHRERLARLLHRVHQHRHPDDLRRLARTERQRFRDGGVVVARIRRSVLSRVFDRYHLAALRMQGYREDRIVALGNRRRVVNGQSRHRVCRDRPDAPCVVERRSRRVPQFHLEVFTRLGHRIREHRHLDGLRRLQGVEAERPRGPGVVGTGYGGVVDRRVTDGHRLAARIAQPHREDRLATFRHRCRIRNR